MASGGTNGGGSSKRMDRLERDLALTARVVKRLVRAGVSLRSDVRKQEQAIARHEEWLARHQEVMSEIDDKLNAMIDLVDKTIRRNGKGA